MPEDVNKRRANRTLVASFQFSAEREIVNIETEVLGGILVFDSGDYSYGCDFHPRADHSSIPFRVAKHGLLKRDFMAIKNLDRERSSAPGYDGMRSLKGVNRFSFRQGSRQLGQSRSRSRSQGLLWVKKMARFVSDLMTPTRGWIVFEKGSLRPWVFRSIYCRVRLV